MKVSSLLKEGIYEVSFGYNSKMEGYATLMSDITKLSEIEPACQTKNAKIYYRIRLYTYIMIDTAESEIIEELKTIKEDLEMKEHVINPDITLTPEEERFFEESVL